MIPTFAFRALAGEPIQIFGEGAQTRNFVHVDDVVQANIGAVFNRGTSGAFNMGSGTQIGILDLASAVNSHLEALEAIEHLPPRAGDVAHSLPVSEQREKLSVIDTRLTWEKGYETTWRGLSVKR